MNDEILKKIQSTEIKILDEIDRVCKKNNIEYFLVGGTLLGAVRHNGFIPWDDDIDIAMDQSNYNKFVKIAKVELSNSFILDCYKTNRFYSLPFAKIRLKNTLFLESKMKNSRNLQKNKNNGFWVDIFCYQNVDTPFLKKHRFQRKISMYLFTLISIKVGTNYYQNSKLKKKIYSCILKLIPLRLLTKILDIVVNLNKNNNSKYISDICGPLSLEKETLERSKIFPLGVVCFNNKKYPAPNDCDYYLRHVYGDYMKLPPVEKRVTHKPYKIIFDDGEKIDF